MSATPPRLVHTGKVAAGQRLAFDGEEHLNQFLRAGGRTTGGQLDGALARLDKYIEERMALLLSSATPDDVAVMD